VADLLHEDSADVADDIRGLFADIDKAQPDGLRLRGECLPPLDVVETATAVEVIVDIPGVTAPSVRVVMRRNALLIVGAKAPAAGERAMRLHVAERNYGRFARVVRIDSAVDARRAQARLARGQLRVVLPRLSDGRGVAIPIAVEAAH
jgi:HSP20 family protein